MDALKNLFVQANIVDKLHYANRITDHGLLRLLEQIIANAVT